MCYLLVFGVSLFASSFLPVLPRYSIAVVLLLLAIAAFIKHHRIVSIALLGFCISLLNAYHLSNQALPEHLEGQRMTLRGVISDLPVVSERKTRIDFLITEVIDVEFGHAAKDMEGKKIRLSWYSSDLKDKNSKDVKPLSDSQIVPVHSIEKTILQPGQYWELAVKLRRPRGFVNPAGFDYHAYLLRQGIYGVGYVMLSGPPLFNQHNCQQVLIDCLRWRLLNKMSQHSSNQEILGIVAALAIGYTSLLPDNYWALLKNTGTVHLLAISGLHIGLAATIGFFIGIFIRRFLQFTIIFSTASRYVPSLLSLLLAVIYSLLAGMSLPTQRALMMVLVFHISLLCYRKVSPYVLLLLALIGIGIIDPLGVFSAGFWLSFLAVLLLIMAFHQRRPFYRRLCHYRYLTGVIQLSYAQYALFLGLFLPGLYWLQGVSIIAPMANMIAVSAVSFIIVPLITVCLVLLSLPQASFIFLGGLIYGYVEYSLELLMVFLEWLSHITHVLGIEAFKPLAIITPSWWVSLLFAIGVFVFLLPRGFAYRIVALCCLLPLFFYKADRPPLVVTFLDVGQGTAIVIETRKHTLVYDVGRVFSPRFDVGRDIVSPYLRSQGVEQVDRLLVSHSDSDHSGGMEGLLASINVKHIMLGQYVTHRSMAQQSEAYQSKIHQTSTLHQQTSLCNKGQHWRWDKVDFHILWPDRRQTSVLGNDNNYSCVLLIEYEGARVLLTGDIEKSVEYQMVHSDDPLLTVPIDILLVPHHGSKTSSSSPWIKFLKPTWSVVTAGYRNSYNHPHPVVLDRYQRIGSTIINTASSGYVQFIMDSETKKWTLAEGRKKALRYWFDVK